MKKTKSFIWLLLFIIFLAIFLWSAYQIATQLLVYRAAENEYKELSDLARTEADTQETDDEANPVDFEALSAINPDIVGWVYIGDTVIDYPIVQTSDNETYLSKTFYGETNSSGAIFMDMYNSPDFSDKNTLIYGHHMKNGSMFAELSSYQEQAFYDEHPIVMIYTPDGVYTCEIFSAYVTEADSQTYTFEFSDQESFGSYLKYVTSNSQVATDVTVQSTDRIITLSTCAYNFDEARMVVHAVISDFKS